MSDKSPLWQPTGPEGLYLNTQSGVYYSRYRLNGSRTFRSLKTRIFTVAKLKHAKRQVDVEKDRQRGAGIGSNFQTLGGLLVEMKARLEAIPVAENTKIGRNITSNACRPTGGEAASRRFLRATPPLT